VAGPAAVEPALTVLDSPEQSRMRHGLRLACAEFSGWWRLATPGLYFIGEVLGVTGWLGGYNVQLAWASGFAAGQSV